MFSRVATSRHISVLSQQRAATAQLAGELALTPDFGTRLVETYRVIHLRLQPVQMHWNSAASFRACCKDKISIADAGSRTAGWHLLILTI